MSDKFSEGDRTPKSPDTPKARAFLRVLVDLRGLDKENGQPQIIPFKEVERSISESTLKKEKESLSGSEDTLSTYERIDGKIKAKSEKIAKRSDYQYRTAKYHIKSLYYIILRDKEHSNRVVSLSFVHVWEQSEGDQVRASALMSTGVKELDRRKGRAFIKITGIGGFKGWIDKDALKKPTLGEFQKGTDIGQVSPSRLVVVTTPELETPIYRNANGDETLETVEEAYFWTKLRLINTDNNSERWRVLLPGGEEVGWVKKGDVTLRDIDDPYPKQPPDVIAGYARAFQEKSTSYREKAEQNPDEKKKHTFGWGEIYWKGTDSSGLVQTCLRMGGYDLPRNTRSQYRYCKAHRELFQPLSEKEARKPGDLIFFLDKSGEAYYVAIASDAHNYIHSVDINPSKPKELGVIKSCLKDCTTEGHDPYMAKKAVGYVVMRLR